MYTAVEIPNVTKTDRTAVAKYNTYIIIYIHYMQSLLFMFTYHAHYNIILLHSLPGITPYLYIYTR